MFRSKIFSSIVTAIGSLGKKKVPTQEAKVPGHQSAVRARFRRSYKLTPRQKGLTITFAKEYVAHIPWSRYREEESLFRDPGKPTIQELMQICPKLEQHYLARQQAKVDNADQGSEEVN